MRQKGLIQLTAVLATLDIDLGTQDENIWTEAFFAPINLSVSLAHISLTSFRTILTPWLIQYSKSKKHSIWLLLRTGCMSSSSNAALIIFTTIKYQILTGLKLGLKTQEPGKNSSGTLPLWLLPLICFLPPYSHTYVLTPPLKCFTYWILLSTQRKCTM